ncbi:MAG TPA: hypothetical protein VKK19_17795 [Candidatus Dormibacteraeota bacterium]|nr:hypothetical protein [Candidatus Dormibacteraeota bacterium]
MEAFDLAAGLEVVGGGVLTDDPEAIAFGPEQEAAAAGAAAEDGSAIGEQEAGGPNSLTAE